MLNAKKTYNKKYAVRIIILCYGLVPFIASFICAVLLIIGGMFILEQPIIACVIIAVFIAAAYYANKFIGSNFPSGFTARYLPVCLPILITLMYVAVLMLTTKGLAGHSAFFLLIFSGMAFFPSNIVLSLMSYFNMLFIIPLVYQFAFLMFFIIKDRRVEQRANITTYSKRIAAGLIMFAVASCSVIGAVLYAKSQTVLPRDYGFKHGGGYASVDIYRYDINNTDNILPVLDSPSSFIIKDDRKMPVLDGAEAAYPVYSAFANACYARIANMHDNARNKITFTNTIYAFERLINGEVDIFFGAQPSAAQESYARSAGKKLVLTPIAKDAFVFFVNRNNPCDAMTTDNIKEIYSGKVNNWAKFTGRNERIFAFQRPENSGSQTIMQMIMGDAALTAPLREEYVGGMGGVSDGVADYRNYPGAIGYSFRFFTTAMADGADMIKFLTINGIEPSSENIANSSYPYTVSLYAITVEDNRLDTIVPFLEWMRGPEGQELIEKIGYIPLK